MSRLRLCSISAPRTLASIALLAGVAGCGTAADPGTNPETTTAAEGELVRYGGISLDGQRYVKYGLRTAAGRELELDFDEAPDLRSGARLRVGGELLSTDKFHVRDFDLIKSDAKLGVARQPLIQHGPKRVAVIMAHWNQPASVTAQQIRNEFFNNPNSGAALIGESSFGKVTVTGDVFGWYQIQAPENIGGRDGCNTAQIVERAKAAAQAAGVNLSGYQHLAFFVNGAPCTFVGLGEIGTPAVPLPHTWYNGFFGGSLFAHEIGHNLGFLHAVSYSCGSTIAERALCTSGDYGDPFDAMGVANTQFGAYEKAAQNWFEACDVVTTPRTGVFDIAPSELAANAVQLLRVPMNASLCPVATEGPCYYHLSSRRPLGVFDGAEPYASSPMGTGLMLHAGVGIDTSGNSLLQSAYLLDTTPGSQPSAGGPFWDASLAPGRTFADPTGIRVRVMSQTPSLTRVAVKVPNGTGPISCLDGTQITTPSSCANGVQNAGETDIDCGGTTCIPCDDAKHCAINADCWSGSCISGTCQPSCTDAVKNGSETDVDCGGSCSADCATGAHCNVATDCQSGVCTNGSCSSSQLVSTLNVHSNWQTGFCGMINLQNTASTATQNWTVRVNFEHSTFTSTSGGVFTPIGGGVYDITPVEYNRVIWPSSHTTISLCANKTGPNYFPELLFANVQY